MTAIKSKRIGVLAGGPSSEREISLQSGRSVYNALKEEGYDVIFIDVPGDMSGLRRALEKGGVEVAFIALHGRFGEDGTVQSGLEEMSIPYTGSGPRASMLALDKLASKRVFAEQNINTPAYRAFRQGQKIDADSLDLPVVIKPRREGSSIGLSVVRTKDELKEALEVAYRYDDTIIAEKRIEGNEITVGILDDEPLCAIQIVPGGEFYDYEAKYESPDTAYLVPAPLTLSLSRAGQLLGKRAHAALGCRGFSRVDMILGDGGEFFVLEVNTIPGLTSRSLLPKAAQHAGISFNRLCERIISIALTHRGYYGEESKDQATADKADSRCQ